MKIATDLDLSGVFVPGAYTASDISNISPPVTSLIWNSDTRQFEYFIGGSVWLDLKVSSFARLATDGGADNTINRNTIAHTNVIFNGVSTLKNANFVVPAGIGAIRTAYDGFCKISYTIPHTSTGARAGLESLVTRTRGVAVNSFAYDYSYMRNASGHNKECCSASDIVDCQAGDLFRLSTKRNGTITTAINFIDIAALTVEKI